VSGLSFTVNERVITLAMLFGEKKGKECLHHAGVAVSERGLMMQAT
jgi:hypothetical protein